MATQSPLKSKKFIAYSFAEISWKLIIVFFMIKVADKLDHYSFGIMMTLIIVSGFVQVGYILGQAALDKYLHVTAHLTSGQSKKDSTE